jgi:hypothetical protein
MGVDILGALARARLLEIVKERQESGDRLALRISPVRKIWGLA